MGCFQGPSLLFSPFWACTHTHTHTHTHTDTFSLKTLSLSYKFLRNVSLLIVQGPRSHWIVYKLWNSRQYSLLLAEAPSELRGDQLYCNFLWVGFLNNPVKMRRTRAASQLVWPDKPWRRNPIFCLSPSVSKPREELCKDRLPWLIYFSPLSVS